MDDRRLAVEHAGAARARDRARTLDGGQKRDDLARTDHGPADLADTTDTASARAAVHDERCVVGEQSRELLHVARPRGLGERGEQRAVLLA